MPRKELTEEEKTKNTEYMKKWYRENIEHVVAYRDAYKERNREKLADGKREWYLKNRERILSSPSRKEDSRNRHLIKTYNITSEEFDALYSKQGGRCASCGEHFPPRGVSGLHVDHCSISMAVRSLLCGNCNRMIGIAGHNPAILMRGMLYLESHLGEVNA